MARKSLLGNISLYKEWKRIVCGLGFFFFFGFLCKPVCNHLTFKIYLVDFWKSQFVPKLRIWYICFNLSNIHLRQNISILDHTPKLRVFYISAILSSDIDNIYISIYIYIGNMSSELKLYMTYREFKYRSFT